MMGSILIIEKRLGVENKDRSFQHNFIKLIRYAKKYSSLIALVIPIMGVLLAFAFNYVCYLANVGFYRFYEIDKKLMMPNIISSLYEILTTGIIFFAILIYSIFAVRIWFLKRNFFGKTLMWGVIPLVPIFLSLFSAYEDISITWSAVVYILIIWVLELILIFALGYFVAHPLQEDILNERSKYRKKRLVRNNSCSPRKKKGKWGNHEFFWFGLLIIFVAVILFGYYLTNNQYQKAERKTNYGIVNINNERYAVIDADLERLILQKCHCENNNLTIYTNTFIEMENNILIEYVNFENVNREKWQDGRE